MNINYYKNLMEYIGSMVSIVIGGLLSGFLRYLEYKDLDKYYKILLK